MHDFVKTARQFYSLTKQELYQFRKLRPIEGEAIDFWAKVAISRGLDPQTIISDRKGFSGLPENHGKPWCYPMRLKCRKRPVYEGFVPNELSREF